ncbi:hypothetical protein HPB49_003355 [Dermacentor silvarum]|uniref:Uncharacterized protein n=1 Tax=Dermacentor silvarum TaxID=543639 RepID=A0ACB8DTG9_DERSI|nr:hypothetical protein HPB49_003355 [Dermacentor silvarum]
METIIKVKMRSTSLWKPCQAGLLISTTVVMRLQEVLLGNEGCDFCLSNRLLQVCLENLFSVVRLRKPVPRANVKVYTEGGTDNWEILMVTPIMKHAQLLESSTEVIFLDSTASCDTKPSTDSQLLLRPSVFYRTAEHLRAV